MVILEIVSLEHLLCGFRRLHWHGVKCLLIKGAHYLNCYHWSLIHGRPNFRSWLSEILPHSINIALAVQTNSGPPLQMSLRSGCPRAPSGGQQGPVGRVALASGHDKLPTRMGSWVCDIRKWSPGSEIVGKFPDNSPVGKTCHCCVQMFNLCSFTFFYLYWSLLATAKTRQNETKCEKNVDFYFVCFKWQGSPVYGGSSSIMSPIWVGSNDPNEPEFHLKVFEVPRNWGQWVCSRTELRR